MASLAPSHGVQVGRVDVFREQHVPGHCLQCTAFLAPGAASGMFRIEPAGLVLRQPRPFPPRRDAAGQGAHLFRQRRLRRFDLPPIRHREPYMRIELLGGLEPFAQVRHLPVAGRMQLRVAGLCGPFAKRGPRPFEAFGIVEEPRAFERLDRACKPGRSSRHGMEVVDHHAARRLALRLHQAPARLQKRRPFLAPGVVFGKLLDGQSLRGSGPAELRPAPPVLLDPLGQVPHLAVAREMPLVLRQHGAGKAAHVGRQVLDRGQRRRPCHHAPVAGKEDGYRLRLFGLLPESPPVFGKGRKHLQVNGRYLRGIDAQRLQRTVLQPGSRLEKLDQRLAVVGQQQEPVAHPAELDVEELPVRRAAGIENRDRRMRVRPCAACTVEHQA